MIPENEFEIKNNCPLYNWKFYEDKKLFEQLEEDEPCTLVPEPDNKYDKYAFQIFIHNKKIGYIPRQYSELVSEILKKGGKVRVTIAELNPDADINRRIKVNIVSSIYYKNLLNNSKQIIKNETGYYRHGHELETFPEEIRTITGLKSLVLSANNIKTIPGWLGEITTLETLDLSSNEIESLPESLLNLKNMSEIKLDSNPFNEPELLKESLLFEISRDYNQKVCHGIYSGYSIDIKLSAASYSESIHKIGAFIREYQEKHSKQYKSIGIYQKLKFYTFRNKILKTFGNSASRKYLNNIISSEQREKERCIDKLFDFINNTYWNDYSEKGLFTDILKYKWKHFSDFFEYLEHDWDSLEEYMHFIHKETEVQKVDEKLFLDNEIFFTIKALSYQKELYCLSCNKIKLFDNGIVNLTDKFAGLVDNNYQKFLEKALSEADKNPLYRIFTKGNLFLRKELLIIENNDFISDKYIMAEYKSEAEALYFLEIESILNKNNPPKTLIIRDDIDKIFNLLDKLPDSGKPELPVHLDGTEIQITWKNEGESRIFKWLDGFVNKDWRYLVRVKNEIFRIITDYTDITYAELERNWLCNY